MDLKDEQILSILELDSSISLRDIAKQTKIPLTTIHKRLISLKKSGVIKKYTVELDNEKLGKKFHAYVLISLNLDIMKSKQISQQKIKEILERVAEVRNVNIVIGEAELVLEVFAKNTKDFQKVLLEKIQSIDGISSTRTFMVIG